MRKVLILFSLVLSLSAMDLLIQSSQVKVGLRAVGKKLSPADVKSMLKQKGFFDKSWNKNGSFRNDFLPKNLQGDKVVIDLATGLMWHQSG